MTPNIGVYGAQGWIGLELSKALAQHATTRLFARSGPRPVVAVPTKPDTEWLATQFAGLGAIVVSAGTAHLTDRPGREDDYANAKLPGTIVEAAKRAEVKRVVLLSSVKAVAENSGDSPLSHRTNPAPTTSYGRSKLRGERAAEMAADGDVELCIVRTPLVIGRDAPSNFGRMLNLIRRGLPVPLPHPFAHRSVTVRSNLVSLLSHLARVDSPIPRLAMAAESEACTTAELVHVTAAAIGSSSRVIPLPSRMVERSLRFIGLTGAASALLTDLEVEPSGSVHLAGWVRPAGIAAALANELSIQGTS